MQSVKEDKQEDKLTQLKSLVSLDNTNGYTLSSIRLLQWVSNQVAAPSRMETSESFGPFQGSSGENTYYNSAQSGFYGAFSNL